MEGLSSKFTRRGIKKCPNCRNLIGTRSLNCSKCKFQFSVGKSKKKSSTKKNSQEAERSVSYEEREEYVWKHEMEGFEINYLSDLPLEILPEQSDELEPSEIFYPTEQEPPDQDQIIYQDFELTDCQIELLDEFSLTDKIDIPNDNSHSNYEFHDIEKELLEFEQVEKNLEEEIIKTESESKEKSIKNKVQIINKYLVKKLLKKQTNQSDSDAEKLNLQTFIKLLSSNGILLSQAKIKDGSGPVYSPEQVSIDFNQWLNSIIERIHFEMDFNGTANSRTLTFSVNHNFFKCLSARFSIRNDKKRKPNKIVKISKGLYMGLETSVWIFSSLAMVKQIFQTDSMSIETEQKFMKVSESPPRYERFVIDDVPVPQGFPKISPKLFSTRIKVNPTTRKEKENPFTISWTPNVLRKSQYGELEIKFYYERKFVTDQNQKIKSKK